MNMSLIKSTGNKSTERRLAASLSAAGLSGWIKQLRPMGISADIVFPGYKLAIFTDGCFWHGCPKHAQQNRLRTDWRKKISRNMARDRAQKTLLNAAGWAVIRAWEHTLSTTSGRAEIVDKIRCALELRALTGKHAHNLVSRETSWI